jgi:hypothetical protein
MSDERPVDTDCRKCKSAMVTPRPPKSGEVPFPAIALEAIYQVTVKVTGYRCLKCGHWNDLTRRKPRKAKK